MITAFFNHLYLSVKANFDIQDLNWMCKVSFMFTVDLFDQELYTRMNIEEEKKTADHNNNNKKKKNTLSNTSNQSIPFNM